MSRRVGGVGGVGGVDGGVAVGRVGLGVGGSRVGVVVAAAVEVMAGRMSLLGRRDVMCCVDLGDWWCMS